MAAPVQGGGLLFGPEQIASSLARYQANPLGAQYIPEAQVNGLSPYQQIMARMGTPRVPVAAAGGTGGFTYMPLQPRSVGDISQPAINVDSGFGIPIFDNPITEPEAPTQEERMSDEEAIQRIEDEVAQEQYDQENQDAIDRVEQAVEEERVQQTINDLEQSVRDEALAESARASEIDDATISTEPVYVADDGTTASIEDTIREIAPVEPTPEGLLTTDEFGDLDQAIELERYAQETQDAINKYQQEIRDEAVSQALAQENPYGNLDEAIAANALADSALASDIDAATIGIDNFGTYSGFTPAPANPNIPIEDAVVSDVQEPVMSLLDVGVDPITGVARDNGAAAAAIREQEAIDREEATRLSEMMASFEAAQPQEQYVPPYIEPEGLLGPVVQPEAPYVEPVAQPYVEPLAQPYIEPEGLLGPVVQPYIEPVAEPVMQPYVEPYVEPVVQQPYVEPYVPPEAPYVEPYVPPYVEPQAPYIEPVAQPYVPPESPYVEPYVPSYVEPYIQPEAPYVEPYIQPYVEPYIQPYVPPEAPYVEPYIQPEGLIGQTIDSFTAPEAPFFVNNPYISPTEVIQPEGLLNPYSEMTFSGGGGGGGAGFGGDYGNNFANEFGGLEDLDLSSNYLLY